MSFFPEGFDYRSPVLQFLDLCIVDTAQGAQGFIIGADGMFTDVNGVSYVGSRMLEAAPIGIANSGDAAEGSLTFSFFQDPSAPDLISQMREMGVDAIAGRAITFYLQPIADASEFSAPKAAPIQWMRRTMRTMAFKAEGPQQRSITVTFEAWTEQRKSARRIVLNTKGHARLIGAENPSLRYMPTDDYQEEKLFG